MKLYVGPILQTTDKYLAGGSRPIFFLDGLPTVSVQFSDRYWRSPSNIGPILMSTSVLQRIATSYFFLFNSMVLDEDTVQVFILWVTTLAQLKFEYYILRKKDKKRKLVLWIVKSSNFFINTTTSYSLIHHVVSTGF